jgi:hypothetical protein
LADVEKLEAAARERTPAAAPAGGAESSGRAFFERKKADRTIREEGLAMAEEAAGEIHARLGQEAAATAVLPPQDPKLSGRAGRMILNGAYLVDRSGAGRFTEIGRALDERYRPMGVGLELTGPWAPYNFAAATEADGER